ncbi:MAG TPA: DsbA family oxidoreductase [Polyangiaceae bacterium]|nr:DsbA family oxidoreductase [Polyangiaceae bacterium]
MKQLQVNVWSDVVCPWCYVGKRRLEAALARFAHRDAVAITWRAFELNPASERVYEPDVYVNGLAAKYGLTAERARAMMAQTTEVARADGLDFRFDRLHHGNTFDAHRLLRLARERGIQAAVKERFLHAFWTEGEPIGDPKALARLAVEAGLDAAEVASVLEGDAYAREVRADQVEARERGQRVVPFYVIGGHNISGTQPPEKLLEVLEKAWSEVSPSQALPAEGVA